MENTEQDDILEHSAAKRPRLSSNVSNDGDGASIKSNATDEYVMDLKEDGVNVSTSNGDTGTVDTTKVIGETAREEDTSIGNGDTGAEDTNKVISETAREEDNCTGNGDTGAVDTTKVIGETAREEDTSIGNGDTGAEDTTKVIGEIAREEDTSTGNGDTGKVDTSKVIGETAREEDTSTGNGDTGTVDTNKVVKETIGEEDTSTGKGETQTEDDTSRANGESGAEEGARVDGDITQPVIDAGNNVDQAVTLRLTKIPSVLRDAELIAGIVEGLGVDEIYDKLKERRADPNRVDVIINEILEKVDKRREMPISKSTLLEDFVKVIDKAMANLDSLPVSAEEIHKLLGQENDAPDRVDRVVTKLFKKYYDNFIPGNNDEGGNRRENFKIDVRKVISTLPGADPDEVSDLLRQYTGAGDRVEMVINFLKSRTAIKLTRADTLPDDPALRNDPLYRDMRIIAKILPDINPNEIYAFLEAYHDRKNRIQLVIEEMMKIASDSQVSTGSLSRTGSFEFEQLPVTGHKIPYNINDEVQELQEIFPDCDPGYLYNELEKKQDDKERMKTIAMALFENKGYPKRVDVEKGKILDQAKERIENLKFEMDTFLMKFPDPVKTFDSYDTYRGSNYTTHTTVQIHNDFKELKKGFLKHIMKKFKYHYTPCKENIAERIKDLPTENNKFKSDPRTEDEFPFDPDEFFFYEKLYCAHKEEIKAKLEEDKHLKQVRLEQARENGELLTCGCCFDDECLIEDMSTCADGHIFCVECIRRSAEVIIGSSQCDFPCIEDKCTYKFPLPVLQGVLPSNMFSILLKRVQEEEIKKADIPDLVSCPFCNFATIMSNPEDKIFRCLNPECLKDSCRLCREPDHVPLRCDEIEKRGETSLRTYIETRVTEAMLRRCHSCEKYFYKEYGCNKMTCVCGAEMCYLCRESGVDYDHFGDEDDEEEEDEENKEKKCPLYSEMNDVHYKEMSDAAMAAKEQYIKEHPDAEDIVLNYDIEKHINDMKGREQRNYPAEGDEDDYDSAGNSVKTEYSDSDGDWRDEDDTDPDE